MTDEIPRRHRLDLCSPAELAIRQAMLAVEVMPADIRLTNAVVMLGDARDKVADYIDANPLTPMAARCVICDHEVESTEGLKACPKCGGKGIPCDPKEDVYVKINWHELRILCIWAEFHASAHPECEPPMGQTVYSIVRRLEVRHPQLKTPLTLGGELRQLKTEYPGLETNIPHDPGFDPTNQ